MDQFEESVKEINNLITHHKLQADYFEFLLSTIKKQEKESSNSLVDERGEWLYYEPQN